MTTTASYVRNAVTLTLLFCCFWTPSNARQQPTNCQYEELPSSFDLPSYLDFNQDFHIHGEFFVNLSRAGDHLITFRPKQESIARFYASPHAADADLWLYKGIWNSTSYMTSMKYSLSIDHEESLYATLEANTDYTLRLNFFDAWLDMYEIGECETIFFEVQIALAQTVRDRALPLTSRSTELPTLDVKFDDLWFFDSPWNQTNNFIKNPASNNVEDITVVKSYTLHVPATNGRTWRLEASLGAEFLYGGSFGLVVKEGSEAITSDFSCVQTGKCTVGFRSQLNEHTLKVNLISERTYVLSVFDRVGQKMSQVSDKAVPVTLNVYPISVPQTNNFATCSAPTLPDELPTPFEEPKDTFHYSEKALVDTNKPVHTIKLKVAKKSYFRIHTLAHRIDIDLRLQNTSGEIASELGFGSREEAIALVLEAGNYDLQISFWGTYDPVPCETFTIEIALAPLLAYDTPASTHCPQDKIPSSDLGSFYQESTKREDTYYFNLKDDFTVRNISISKFVVSRDLHFRAELGANFVLFDLNIKLLGPDGTISGEPRRNHEVISALLSPGTHYLVVSTSHSGSKSLGHFPSCAQFDLTIDTFLDRHPALTYPQFPASLNGPGYLAGGTFVHFAEEFLLPLVSTGEWTVTKKTTFTVKTQSIFRLWSEPHDIDIDFTLKEDSNIVASTLAIGSEETVFFVVNPGKSYELSLHYYRFSSVGPVHARGYYTANMELEIAPVTEDPPSGPTVWPAGNWIGNFNPSTCTGAACNIQKSDTFSYDQSMTQTEHRIHFRIHGTDAATFRVMVESDFLYGDLSIDVRDHAQTVIARGVGGYNRMEILPKTLTPLDGDYTLVITEPANNDRPRHVQFRLTVAMAPATGTSQTHTCPAVFLPYSMNSPTYMSDLSGQQTHWNKKLLVPPSSAWRDYSLFHVSQRSLFSLVIPLHDVVDVDVVVKNGTWAEPTGRNLILLTSYNEESAHIILEPGPYFLELRFYSQPGKAFPTTDCYYYPAQLSIVPTATLDGVQSLNRNCPTTKPPARLASSSHSHRYQRDLTAEEFSHVLVVEATRPTFFEIDIYFNFPVAALSMALVGTSGPAVIHQDSVQGMSHQTLHRLLGPGNYSLSIHDSFQRFGRIGNYKCAEYHVTWTYDSPASGSIPPLEEQCMIASALPKDLGADSVPFGGPQSPTDGSFRIWGEDFLLKTGANYIKFDVKQVSYARAFAQGDHTADDIDFLFYANTTTTIPIATSMGIDTKESAVVKLQPGTHYLDVNVWQIGSLEECPLFHLEFAMKTESQIRGELTCPYNLPENHTPPSRVDLSTMSADGVVHADGLHQSYYFTKDDVSRNTQWGQFEWTTTLTTTKEAFIYTAVMFDFVANDFRISIYNSENQLIEDGISSGMFSRDSYINFESWFFAELPPGTYTLKIKENVYRGKFDFEQFCHKFEFMLFNFGDVDPQLSPMLEFVWPVDGHEIEPNEDLYAYMDFSQDIGTPNERDQENILTWLKNNDAMYLLESRTNQKIFPSQALLWHAEGLASLDLVYPAASIAADHEYTLHTEIGKFKNSQGHAYINPFGDPTFRSLGTTCNGHGDMRDGVCVCREGYAGPTCDSCAYGYHSKDGHCVKDEPVNCPENCHNHGECINVQGTGVCMCHLGYFGVSCDKCMDGYKKEGDACVAKNDPDADAQPMQCEDLILPEDLNTWGLLHPNNEVHIQGEFYIDIRRGKHDTYFALEEDSVVRVYVEPHTIDVDIWLFEMVGTTQKYIEGRIAINEEEVVFKELKGVAGAAKKYLLQFRYFDWESATSSAAAVDPCHSVNMELAIVPVNRAKEVASRMKQTCESSQYPYKIPTTADFGSGSIPVIERDHTIQQPNMFVKQVHTRNANFIGSARFQVKTGSYWELVQFHATTSTQFSFGDVAMLLEDGEQSNHCSSGSTDRCITSSPKYNGNTLHLSLTQGNYTLWFYEPASQNGNISSCTVFDFEAKFEYANSLDEEINCHGTELPKNLNGPGYIVSDYMHIVDDYLVNDANIPFKVTKQSVFRAYGTSYFENLKFSVTRKNSYTPLKQTGTERHPDLFVDLTPGDYVFRIDASAVNLDYCPEMRLEMALKPKDSLIRRTCGRFWTPRPVFRGELPFGFGSTEGSVYFGNTAQEQVMTPVILNFTQTVFISATVVSDFLLSNLQLVVVPLNAGFGRGDAVWGKHNYNSHELANYFSAGAYELQLRSNVHASAQTIGLDACGPFDFDLNIFTVGQLWNNPCNASGLTLPHSFNGIQHLGSNNRFNQAGRYRTPPLSGHDTHEIHFNVSVPSYIRIKLEPHAVDVDVVLMSKDPDGTVRHIADGGYTFNMEESVAWDNLVPGTKYYVLLHFWLFEGLNTECPEFIMHTSITPKSDVSIRAVCASNPPPHPDDRRTYRYSSQDQVPMVIHQFQQSARTTEKFSFEFTVDQDVGMYVETTYDFISSDLSLLLDGPDGQFYGVDFGHGSRIRERMLTKGSYKITIYQPVALLDGCSEYHFQLIFSPALPNHGRTSTLRLPSSLNSAGDLKFSQDTHFSNVYNLFAKSDRETIEMRLPVESIVRISADPHNVLAEEVYVKVGGRSYLQSYLGQLPTGLQTITFDRAVASSGSQKSVDIGVEIAVYPVSLVRDRAGKNPTSSCGGERLREISLNLDGHYSSNELLPLATSHTERILEEKSLNLKKKSFVHVSLGFDFVNSDLEIEIVEVNSGALHFGKNHKNSHEYRDVLPAGSYKLRIVQNDNIAALSIAQCSKFHVRIYIGDADDAFQSADCASKDLLPWNLNNFAGHDPVINLYGSKFLMRGASQMMYVNITSPSLLSIFTRKTFYEDVQFRVYKSHSDHRWYDVESAFSSSTAAGREAVFVLDTLAQTGPTQYEIEMTYTIDEYSSEACPTFGLQLILAPNDHARQTTTCPSTNNSEGDLPTEAVVDNQAVSKFFDGTINSDFFTHHFDFAHEGFVWNTTLSVKNEATLSVQVGYDDLISHFEAVLFRRTPREQQSAMTNREIITPQLSSYNAMQSLTQTLYAGNYTLSLKAHSVDIHHLFDMDLACLPLLYNMQLVPPGAPHVLAVNPPAGRSLDPSSPFTIDMQFSGPIRINSEDVFRNANLLQSRVALTENHGTKRDDVIHPTEVTAKGETVYALRFDTGKLSASKSYHLTIVGEIRDKTGNLYQLTSHNKYTTLDTGCSGHGHVSGGVCICDEGYSGASCNFCSYGYTEKTPKSNPPVCVKQNGQCRVDSCGCDPLVRTYCKPLGQCVESNGNFTCICPKHFAGDRCEKCAADRVDYAQGCRPVDGCGRCDYGHCSASTNYKCVCDKGYTGEQCDVQTNVSSDDEQAANGLRVAGIIFGVFVILATVAFFAYSKLGPNRGQRYLAVDADMESAAEMSLFDDEEEDNHRRFDDRQPEEEEEPAPAPKRHEPQAEERLFSLDD